MPRRSTRRRQVPWARRFVNFGLYASALAIAAIDFVHGACGAFVCNEAGDDVLCDDPGLNACGACGTLTNEIGTPCDFGCGDGVWVCSEDGSAAVCNAPRRNECGGCVELPVGERPFDACDNCGEFVCRGFDDTVCIAGLVNDCGGCVDSPLLEGDACTVCGDAGVVVCDDTLTPTCSTEASANACGGCDALASLPGDACGGCGQFVCARADVVRCVDPCAS